MYLSLDMHLQPVVSVGGALKSTTHLADLHVPVWLIRLRLRSLIKLEIHHKVRGRLLPRQSRLHIHLLFYVFLHLLQDGFRLIEVARLSLLLGISGEKVDLLVHLVNSLVELFFLVLV